MTPPDSTLAAVSEPSMATKSNTKWPRYVDATLGFPEHWHPAAFSDEVTEGSFVPVTLLGKSILLTRTDGHVRAIADRCAHRGVRFSAQPLCFKKGTISCWYHGWTYSLQDGELVDVLTSPGSPVIGQVNIPVFATEEAKGLIFVFVGDGEAHPLQNDLPPGFLDPDTYALGIRRRVQSNWRLGAENGFDSTHIFMHRNSPLIEKNKLAIPYGLVPAGREAVEVVNTADWPKGVIDHFDQNYVPVFHAELDGEKVLEYVPPEDAKLVAAKVSIWLPGVLKVYPFPDPTLTQYEFYVAVNETEHEYFQVLQRTVNSPEDIEEFRREFDETWKDLALHGFNDDDVWARECQQEFYGSGKGWEEECLFPPDVSIVRWRQLANEHARGVLQ
ncbi:Rieske 2Fe-2S domain-containing protein [Nocardia sp. R6R-6]|uniref:Rieske 2Fe-2S domain-containing protein n=1 Tax=Nocardia sp. R6R-6 TaxID=3459303 RepID=UPI00403D6800